MNLDTVDRPPAGKDAPLPATPAPPAAPNARPVRTTLRSVGLALAATASLLGLAVGAAALKAGSLGAGVALLAGDSLYAGPATLTLSGTGSPAREVLITNLSSNAIRVVGYNATCSCVKVANLPLTLNPHERKSVVLHAESPVSNNVPVVFLTDAKEQSFVQIVAKVVADAGPPPGPK